MTLKHRLPKLMLLCGMVGPAVGDPSLCGSDEQVFFNCRMKGSAKLVSLCGSRSLDRDRGYLQYRFGRPDAIELEFPKEKAGSPRQFRFAHYVRYQVDRMELEFENGGYQYVLYDDYEGEQKPARRERGVSVTGSGAASKTVDLVCGDSITSRLNALEAVVSCDADNNLNMGSCR